MERVLGLLPHGYEQQPQILEFPRFRGHLDLRNTRSGSLDCTPPQQLESDGELKAWTPVRIGVAAEALNVLVPQGFNDS